MPMSALPNVRISFTSEYAIKKNLSQIPIQPDGSAVCPDCSERIKTGRGGLQNLLTQHMGSAK